MLKQIITTQILFIDIETVPAFQTYAELPERIKKLWDKKSEKINTESLLADENYQRAGIYAEFGKIICISAGFILNDKSFRIKSFFGENEKQILIEFKELLDKYYSTDDKYLCAHNGKEFDYPYIARRMLINGIALPLILDIAGKKPWEVRHLDTLELWKFGDYKNYTSLDLLTEIFNIPSPKDDIDGSMVAKIFYEEKNLNRIVNYCEKDVLAVAQILLKYKNETLIRSDKVLST
jgi:predicted PolB exonuclease-like 3'-5' exonuclease